MGSPASETELSGENGIVNEFTLGIQETFRFESVRIGVIRRIVQDGPVNSSKLCALVKFIRNTTYQAFRAHITELSIRGKHRNTETQHA